MTIIPNAGKINEASESSGTPSSFSTNYTLEFARLFKNLCAEVVQRAELQQQLPQPPAKSKTQLSLF